MPPRASSLDSSAEEAIAWMVELRSGSTTAADRLAFDQWLQQDPQHRAAWQKLGGALDHTFGAKPSTPLEHSSIHASAVDITLQRAARQAGQRRRLLRGALGVTGIGLGSAWVARNSGVIPDWNADLHTATGERRTITLADGSTLLLDARSSADVDFSYAQRSVHLRRGQLIAQVRAGHAVPFVVRSREGSVRALGTRYLVRQAEGRTLALVLEHSVEIATTGGARHVLQEGQAAWFNADTVEPVPADQWPAGAASWSRGMLQAQDMALGDVVEALRAYRHGLIRIAPEAVRLRVTGAYPLDDTDAALLSLAETLPIDVHRHTAGWLVRIEHQR